LLKLSVRIEAPSREWTFSTDEFPEENIWRDCDGRIFAFLSRRFGKIEICFPKFASYFFPEERTGEEQIEVLVVPGETARRDQIFDRLNRNVIPLLLQSRGLQVLHASAIRLGSGVVGFSGRSLCGKSTLAYALSRRGYEVWADDALLIVVANDGVRTFKCTSTRLRLRADSREHFGEINSGSPSSFDDVDACSELSLCAPSEAPLKALYMIDRIQEGDGQGKVWSCNKMAGHDAFTNTLRQASYVDLADIKERRRITEICLCLASKVPIYSCRYQHGFDFVEQVAGEIESCLSRFE